MKRCKDIPEFTELLQTTESVIDIITETARMRSRATTASPSGPAAFPTVLHHPPSISRTVNPPLGRREKTIFFHLSVALRIATSPVRIRTAQKFVCSHGTRPRSTSGRSSIRW
ncbi:hypothetical protein CDAR_568871 [Caerostris darwini]|uniref:Uncharacterized protein n=1 Tax=Caerostris darwini TaxID=1538125 RepID=A0AAV4MGH1_9ARAC|nr:hypothetical protein CDAR_568871 [Caerostris darwini]